MGGSDYSKAEGSDLVIITAGVGQKPGESRLELVDRNKKVMASIIEALRPHLGNAKVLVVSNPLDVVTYQVTKAFPDNIVFGSGTV